MYNFEYTSPSSVDEAAAAVAAGGQVLAGGQTLLATMKQRLAAPETLVDLGKISGLSGVKKDGNSIVIGAMTRHMDVANSDVVQANIPALAALAGQIGDRQVRARGTMGGSVANNDPAACYPSAVLALNATVHTNKRTIAADDFFQGMYTTALEDGELITAIAFEIPKRAAYVKFKQPASRFAMVGVFVAELASGPRVAITGAASSVYRQADMEKALAGNFSAAALDGVAVSAKGLNADLHASADYRAQLVKVVAQRAVTAAA
jgi:aerobic carbon-monoxide dehydrogenase medium subunit